MTILDEGEDNDKSTDVKALQKIKLVFHFEAKQFHAVNANYDEEFLR